MRICSDGHDEIVYDGQPCPVCALQIQIIDLKDEVEELQGELDSEKAEK